MSKGSQIKTMRFSDELIEQIEAAIASANAHRAEVPYDWTAWVRKAVAEKLAHLARRRNGPRSRRAKQPAPEPSPLTWM